MGLVLGWGWYGGGYLVSLRRGVSYKSMNSAHVVLILDLLRSGGFALQVLTEWKRGFVIYLIGSVECP